MKKLYDIVAVTGTYEKDGQTKNRYANCGAVIKNDEGKPCIAWEGLPDSAILHAAKSGKGAIWLSCFEPRQDNQGQGRGQQPQDSTEQSNGVGAQDDDIPF